MEKVRILLAGLGRMGQSHASNLVHSIPEAEVVAVCSIVQEELDWAKNNLGIQNLYQDFDKMVDEKKGEADAVYLVTSTDQHARGIIKGLENGLHVFCEKPLGISITECLEVEEVSKKYPDLNVTLGFVRRYDPSYKYAKELIEAGKIGKPFLVKSQTTDDDTTAPFQLKFAKTGGGAFLDMNIHDVDLARWFLGSEMEQATSYGGCYKHEGFGDFGDVDNAAALTRFENGSMAFFLASRTAPHGHDTHTQILGTEGILRIGHNPRNNHVEILDPTGVRNECVKTFFERFEEAFLLEAKDFVHRIKEGKGPMVGIKDAMMAQKGAIALTKSLKENKTIYVKDVE